MVSMLALVALSSCSEDLGITSVKEAETLDPGKKFSITASMSGADNQLTRGIFVPSTQSDLEQKGFNVTMYTQTAKNAWKTTDNESGKLLFTASEGTYGNAKAMWTESGRNDLYAVYSYMNSVYYDQSNSNHIQGDNGVYPLDGDPVVGHFNGSYQSAIPLDLYHIGAQVRLDVENKSDYDIVVSGELDSFYAAYATNFTWKDPIDYKLSNGTKVKKLPNDCWKVSENNFCSLALGKSAGSVKEPFTNQSGVKTLVRVNTIPILYKSTSEKYPDTQVKFTIYWYKDGVAQEPIVYTKKVEELQAGVCHIYKLNIEGKLFPKAVLAKEVNVDEWTDSSVEWTVKPWEQKKVCLNVSSNDETMGTVNLNGSNQIACGEKVTLKATPKAGYKFVKWSDGNTNATRELEVNSDLTLKAIFAKYKALYVQTNTAYMVSDADAMSLQEDGHTWKATITAGAGTTGFVVPTGTGYTDKVFNLDKENAGKLKLLSPTDTYVYIPITEGTWTFVFNDKTLEYTLTKAKSVSDLKSEAQACVDQYNKEYGDIYEFDNVKEISKASIKAAVDKLKELLTKESVTADELQKAIDKYRYEIEHIQRTDTEVDIEDPKVG